MSEKASEKARREEDVRRQDDPEVEAARKAEEERGGFKELHEAVQRIREAVAARKPPRPEDVELAQRYLGNARVAALLQGLDPEQDPSKKEDDETGDTPGKYRLAVYVRRAEVRGPFDPGQCVIGLEGKGEELLYGFHPGQALGPAQYREGGVNGQILTDRTQLEGAHKTTEVEVTREQLEAIRAQAESLRAKPPSFDFNRWNSINFAAEILGLAGVEIPDGTFAGMATPQSRKGEAKEPAPVETAFDDDADGDDGEGEGGEGGGGEGEGGGGEGGGGEGGGGEGGGEGEGGGDGGGGEGEGDDKKKKPGFFGRLFKGKADKGDKEGGGGSGGAGGGGGQ